MKKGDFVIAFFDGDYQKILISGVSDGLIYGMCMGITMHPVKGIPVCSVIRNLSGGKCTDIESKKKLGEFLNADAIMLCGSPVPGKEPAYYGR